MLPPDVGPADGGVPEGAAMRPLCAVPEAAGSSAETVTLRPTRLNLGTRNTAEAVLHFRLKVAVHVLADNSDARSLHPDELCPRTPQKLLSSEHSAPRDCTQ